MTMSKTDTIGPSIKAPESSSSDSLKIITAEKLAVGYRGNTVWGDASFAINRGELVAVIGPNGAGKTTLFRLLLGLLQPAKGNLRIFNAPPTRGNPRIGYVPQRHFIDSETNTESLELVRLGYSGRKWGLSLFSQNDRKFALAALTDVGAADLAHRPLGELSGGELQRVFLAEALVSNPEILLLDEPLSNLDIRRESELLVVVNEVVRSRKVTALLIAHHINPLLPYLDRVVYIANGKVATGRPAEVLTDESLSTLYGIRIEVLHDSRGNLAIVGLEDTQGEHEQ
jgi:zinc/manganese transport system ATP-binding protein